MHPWFVWIFWINPLAWSFESILATEFHDTQIACVGPNLVPAGQTYNDTTYQACTGIRGASVGASSLTGDQYLHALSFSHGSVWRNIGVVWAWWALYVGLTIFFTTRWRMTANASRSLLIPRENIHLVRAKKAKQDVEFQADEKRPDEIKEQGVSSSSSSSADEKLLSNTSVFTWKNLTYTVSTSEGERTLLDNVYGWVKPGMLGALMGSSGTYLVPS
jgi:ATP-binding cassette subfamily G (WHITE) protein 2 (SNQ2)